MRFLLRIGRVVSLIVLAVLGTCMLMYTAPGYFTDVREMDSAHAASAQAELDQLHQKQGSLGALLRSELSPWLRGDLGHSRQYDVPVSQLLKERAARSGRLLAAGVLSGWALALALALPLSARRRSSTDPLVTFTTATLLALPVGVLATVCVVSNFGGPVLVLGFVIAVRDFKMLYRLLQTTWQAPYLLHARALGATRTQLVVTHLSAILKRELLSLAMISFTLALSVLVPVEVVFDVPGLGQLAWGAAMNRDLPVLVAVTALMAACVGIAGLLIEPSRSVGEAQCA